MGPHAEPTKRGLGKALRDEWRTASEICGAKLKRHMEPIRTCVSLDQPTRLSPYHIL